MTTQIQEALKQLDPANDDLWTSEGLPRLDVLKEMLGNPVSRAQITEAAKMFTRANPVIEVPETEGAGEGSETGGGLAEAGSAGSAGSAGGAGGAGEGGENEGALLQEAVDAAKADVVAATKVLKAAQDKMDVYILAQESNESASVKHANTVKAFQQSQAKAREQEANKGLALKKFLDGSK